MLGLWLLACLTLQEPAETAPPTIDDFIAELGREGVTLHKGPYSADLGQQARVEVPEGYLFADGDSTRRFLELSQNLAAGDELGMVFHLTEEANWTAYFSFSPDGYVEDKEEIDADALLEVMQESTKAGNEERRRRGWPELELVGWHKAPFYDPNTQNLTWSKLLRGEDGETINYSTRLLGREGVMSVDLVIGPEAIEGALPQFNSLLQGFEYKSGRKYAEFREGDKVAEYGLAALVVGGAGALAFKAGLFQKFWKFILIGLAGIGAFVKKFFFKKNASSGEGQG